MYDNGVYLPNSATTDQRGEAILEREGIHRITWRINAGGVGGVTFTLNDKYLTAYFNATQTRVKIATPCKQYDIADARVACKIDYMKSVRFESRWKYTANGITGAARNPRYVRNETRYTPWVDGTGGGTRPRSVGVKSGTHPRYIDVTNITFEGKQIYICVPQVPCSDFVWGMRGGFAKNKSGSFNVTIDASPAVIAERARLAAEKKAAAERLAKKKSIPDIPTPPGTPPAPGIPGTPGIPESPETSLLSKYRIITPLVFDTIGGEQVQRVRYVSVRRLDVEAVSNFVFRGYSVDAVSPDTPLSFNKPYSESVISRAESLKGKTLAHAFAGRGTDKRITWKDIKKKEPRKIVRGGVMHRININRRIIR